MLSAVTSCKVASRRASRAMDEPLPATERMLLRMHLMMCARCTRFVEQLDFLRRAEAGFPEGAAELAASEEAPR